MAWLGGLIKGILEALLPFLFKGGDVHAKDNVQADIGDRAHFADGVSSLHGAGSERSDGEADSVGDGDD